MIHTFTYTDIATNAEYDAIPDSVRLTFNDETIKAIKDAKEALYANKFFSAIEISDNVFDWDTDEDYEGKARYASIKVMNLTNTDGVYAFLTFTNDYTGTTYEIDCSHDISTLMGA
jgi:hypothetical protein